MAIRSGWRLVAGARELDEPSASEPWSRWGWVLGAIWIVFMGFPISDALTAEVSLGAKIAGTALLVVYSVVYLVAYLRMVHADDWSVAARRGLIGIVIMAVLMIAASILVGVGALGACAFLVSLAMFSGSSRRAILLALGIFLAEYAALTIVLALTHRGFEEYGILYMPPAIVLVTVGAMRMLTSAQERHEALARQRDIVAERERVARDVHDVLGHSLTVVTVKAELAERLIDIDPTRAKAEIAEIRSLSREALAEVRATVSGLRVARLGDELAAARSALADAGIEAVIDGSVDDVDPRHRIVAAWVLREAITNVVRHSQASSCRILLAQNVIAVADDGVGIARTDIEQGFRGLRERVAGSGGTLTVTPTDPGTRLEVAW